MNTKSKTIATIMFVILMILSTSCSLFSDQASLHDDGSPIIAGGELEEPGETTGDIELLIPPPEVEVPSADERSAGYEAGLAPMPISSEGGGVSHDSVGEAPPIEVEKGDIEVEQQYNMRAGSVDDNQQWDDYLLYRIQFAETFIRVHDIDVTERHIIYVTNRQGPVLGAEITILNQQGEIVANLMTHSDGKALFFPLVYDHPDESYKVVAEKDGESASYTLDRDQREHVVILNTPTASDPVRLDVHFLIDATGSMSDEISQLRDNMITISERIHALPSNPDVRFGMTTYRDRRDIYVSDTFDFTSDIDQFTRELSQVYADGGGDYPESLNEGLHNAIHTPEWRVEDTISLIFLIADAPPHLDYPDDYDYAEEVFEANERGIKIFPLASSGLDDQGEYIFRQLAQITSAKFLFLTYGADGMPGNSTTHHVDDYSVLSLDQMIVRIVEEEISNLSMPSFYQQ